AVSATCVTGITTYKNGVLGSLNFAGQLVTIILIQIGGLGFITILTFIVTIFKSRLEFRNRYVLAQMVNSTNFADVVKFVRKIILISLICEIMGFCVYFPFLFKCYDGDVSSAIWNSVYHSISSFNNAGFDIFSASMMRTPDSILFNLSTFEYILFCSMTCIMIILGGISFLVILDVFNLKKRPKQWRILTKVVLSTSSVLIVAGTLILWLTDGFKGANSMSFLDCLFESVSSRTAGFVTYSQDNISTIGKIFTCFLMLTGGSPLSTAGGIKTTTIFMLALSMFCYFSSKKVKAFKRSFSTTLIAKAMSLMFLALCTILFAYVLLLIFGIDSSYTYSELGLTSSRNELLFFEAFSCFGTVGFCNGIEPYLSVGSKIVLCFLMFIGRLGPFTFFQIFQKNLDKEEKIHYQFVEEDFLIG
ncbi:MAG: hypothetical protein MJ229_07045, partial [bacterium]|nr:hypothetical protein [bacterium]